MFQVQNILITRFSAFALSSPRNLDWTTRIWKLSYIEDHPRCNGRPAEVGTVSVSISLSLLRGSARGVVSHLHGSCVSRIELQGGKYPSKEGDSHSGIVKRHYDQEDRVCPCV